MSAYYSEVTGGPLAKGEQTLVSIDLPPGKYLAYASASVAISSRAPDFVIAYNGRLVGDGVEHSYIGGLRYESDDPGSRAESVSLQIAIDSSNAKSWTSVSLRFLGSVADLVLVWNPRISVIEVSDFKVLNRAAPPPTIEAYAYD
jgi:hypothetical protein